MLQSLTITLIVYSFGSYRKEQIKLFANTLSLRNMIVISASQKTCGNNSSSAYPCKRARNVRANVCRPIGYSLD